VVKNQQHLFSGAISPAGFRHRFRGCPPENQRAFVRSSVQISVTRRPGKAVPRLFGMVRNPSR
jgi:hypothetical protein